MSRLCCRCSIFFKENRLTWTSSIFSTQAVHSQMLQNSASPQKVGSWCGAPSFQRHLWTTFACYLVVKVQIASRQALYAERVEVWEPCQQTFVGTYVLTHVGIKHALTSCDLSPFHVLFWRQILKVPGGFIVYSNGWQHVLCWQASINLQWLFATSNFLLWRNRKAESQWLRSTRSLRHK